MQNPFGCIVIIAVSILSAWRIRRRTRIESFQQETSRQRYQLPFALPFGIAYLIQYLLFWMILKSESIYLPSAASIFLGYCTHISLCYAVLLLLLPLLRRCISSRVCGYLWMFPMMGFPLLNLGFALNAPLLVIHTPIHLTNTLVIIWAVGVVGILLWFAISHLHFRRQLLRHAQPVKEPQILELWNGVLEISCFKEPLPQLLRSPDTATPLSIGRNPKKMCVILPRKEYSREDLRLIFYHELIHTGRSDVNSKLCYSILAAFFWFNPLMWIALRRITEDLELSCDETTLLCEKEHTRHRYADLLLRTAGSRIGFSTCLSASAKSLRYRLKNTLKPAKRLSGYILAGMFCLFSLLFQGSIAFAYDHNTGAECIFPSADASEYTIYEIYEDSYYDCYGFYEPPRNYHCNDSNALFDYLCSLELYHITGVYHDNVLGYGCTIWYTYEEGKLYIDLKENTVKVSIDTSDRHERYVYYHGGAIDWDYLHSLLEEGYVEEPVPPETQASEPPPLPWHK